MTAVNFDASPQIINTQPATVWTRNQWADTWTERTDLIPLEAEWNLAPEVSTAKLHYRYGRVVLPGANAAADLPRLTGRGYWVLIQFPNDAGTDPWYWLGFAETPIDSDHKPARDLLPASGIQTIPCFGMLDVLRNTTIKTVIHIDPTDLGGDLKRTAGGFTFNDQQKGNRDATKKTITEGADTSDSAYGFTLPDQNNADWWSTRDIVEHLLAFHLPSATGLKGTIPFSIASLTNLPDWDRPVVETDGRDVGSILDELINADRLLEYGIGADATAGNPPSINSIQIEPFTAVATAVTLPAFGNVPANATTYEITNNSDPHTITNVTSDDSDVVDQVTVEGPREIAVATFRHKDNPAIAGELENDWTLVQQANYDAGATLDHPGYGVLKQAEKRRANQIVRNRSDVRDVYRRFRIKPDWGWSRKRIGRGCVRPRWRCYTCAVSLRLSIP